MARKFMISGLIMLAVVVLAPGAKGETGVETQGEIGAIADPLASARREQAGGPISDAEAARQRVQTQLDRRNGEAVAPNEGGVGFAGADPAADVAAPIGGNAVNARPMRRDAVLSGDEAKKAKTGSGVWTTITALGFVIGLILLARWAAVKFLGGKIGALNVKPTSVVQVLSRTPLAPKSHLLLVQVGERILVLSDHASGVRSLAEIDDPDEVLNLMTQTRGSRRHDGAGNLSVDGMGDAFDQGLQKALAEGEFETDLLGGSVSDGAGEFGEFREPTLGGAGLWRWLPRSWAPSTSRTPNQDERTARRAIAGATSRLGRLADAENFGVDLNVDLDDVDLDVDESKSLTDPRGDVAKGLQSRPGSREIIA